MQTSQLRLSRFGLEFSIIREVEEQNFGRCSHLKRPPHADQYLPAGGQMAPRLEPLPRGSAEIVTVDPQKRFAGNIGDSLVAIDKGVVPRDSNCVIGCQGRKVRTGAGMGSLSG